MENNLKLQLLGLRNTIFCFDNTSIYYVVCLYVASLNKPTKLTTWVDMSNAWSPCPAFKVDTVWHGHGKLDVRNAGDYAGSQTQEYNGLLKRRGCTINQEIVIELDPMENHSEIIN